ncbi:MAG: hypothetical protein HYZ14_14800 [Bacteroidetes bacterium]|nr:hypothetical protein [Bacteroidota bacterium]
MAGGKETPRQKMIGMMYLVLTALLALNVSKQIVAAFVTLNDKLDASATIINNKNEDTHAEFDKKRAALQATKGDMKLFELWQGKATELKAETALIVGYLLGECNEMIKTAEGVDWIEEKDEAGNIVKLKPLMEINGMDNYDIPTNMFVGGNPNSPVERGLTIRTKIHEYRDKVAGMMATYTQGKDKNWSFTAPADESGLAEALKTCNPADTAKIAQFYRALTLPEKLHAHEDGEEDMPWPSVIFDHAPIVAAAAMFTSLKLDVKNAESMATEYMLGKIEAPVFNFNKIEPLAFARTGYINQGDSLDLSVMIAAYDSNEVSKIRYGVDADTANEANWKEVSGKIGLHGSSPGLHKVKGVIGVKEKGELAWKPWDFTFTVGQPMGVVAQPELRVLYWGYDNKVEGTASGYDPSSVTLSGSGCSLSSKGNGAYIAKVDRGTRTAKISVSAKKDDGTSVSLGSFDFVCKPMPPAEIKFAGVKSGESIQYTAARGTSKVTVGIDPSSPLQAVNYTVTGGSVYVSGIPGEGKIGAGGSLDSKATGLINQSKGKTIIFEVNYKGPDGVGRIGTMTCKVK